MRSARLCALVAALCVPAQVLGGTFWPQPKAQQFQAQMCGLDASAFTISVTGATSGILSRAITRYSSLIFNRIHTVCCRFACGVGRAPTRRVCAVMAARHTSSMTSPRRPQRSCHGMPRAV
ncbi:hypothetical protein EON67_12545 [archaeon]|nr:MAG: hypothetical protein EON67_12545 [archaeon]